MSWTVGKSFDLCFQDAVTDDWWLAGTASQYADRSLVSARPEKIPCQMWRRSGRLGVVIPHEATESSPALDLVSWCSQLRHRFDQPLVV